MIYENKYGRLDFPNNCKFWNESENININLSGGSDSALLLWMLFKEISETKVKKRLLISTMWARLSVRDGMPGNLDAANNVIKYVSNLYPDVQYERFTHHIDDDLRPYQKPGKNKEYKDLKKQYTDTFNRIINSEIFESAPLSMWGRTANPPEEDRIKYGMNGNRDINRDPGNIKTEKGLSHKDDFNNKSLWGPFAYFSKKFLAEIYKQYDLMDMFGLTESCVGHEKNGLPCKTCWWCKEKYWAFDYYDHFEKPFAICTVLTGKKYSADTVNKLYKSLKLNTDKPFDFYCYTDHTGLDDDIRIIPITNNDKKLQWFKLDYFKKDFIKNEDIILMDIDLDIVGNVNFIFQEYTGFVGTHRWWWRWREDKSNDNFALSGTMYKFKNGEYQYIVDTFEENIEYWQEYFIKNDITKGPVNGEQHFVQKMLVDNNAEKSYFPEQKIVKWSNDVLSQLKLENDFFKYTKLNYIHDEDWHPSIRIVHYAGD